MSAEKVALKVLKGASKVLSTVPAGVLSLTGFLGGFGVPQKIVDKITAAATAALPLGGLLDGAVDLLERSGQPLTDEDWQALDDRYEAARADLAAAIAEKRGDEQ